MQEFAEQSSNWHYRRKQLNFFSIYYVNSIFSDFYCMRKHSLLAFSFSILFMGGK